MSDNSNQDLEPTTKPILGSTYQNPSELYALITACIEEMFCSGPRSVFGLRHRDHHSGCEAEKPIDLGRIFSHNLSITIYYPSSDPTISARIFLLAPA